MLANSRIGLRGSCGQLTVALRQRNQHVASAQCSSCFSSPAWSVASPVPRVDSTHYRAHQLGTLWGPTRRSEGGNSRRIFAPMTSRKAQNGSGRRKSKPFYGITNPLRSRIKSRCTQFLCWTQNFGQNRTQAHTLKTRSRTQHTPMVTFQKTSGDGPPQFPHPRQRIL